MTVLGASTSPEANSVAGQRRILGPFDIGATQVGFRWLWVGPHACCRQCPATDQRRLNCRPDPPGPLSPRTSVAGANPGRFAPQTRRCQLPGICQAVALGMRHQPVDLGFGERSGSRLPTGAVVSLVDPGSVIACLASYFLEGVHMADLNTTLPPALRRALELLAEPPMNPDVSKGYLDLLGTQPVEDAAVPKNTGAIQAVWASPVGSMFYDNTQAVVRRFVHRMAAADRVAEHSAGRDRPGRRLRPRQRHRVAGPRYGYRRAGPRRRHFRADAGTRGPRRGGTADAVVSIAVLQLIPDPPAALAEMARVLRPGGRLAVMVPTAGRAARFLRKLPNAGAYVFGEDELGDILEDHRFVSVRTKNFGTIQWVRGKRG